MTSKQEFLKITIVSAAMMLMLVNIAGAAPFAYVPNYDDNTTTIFDTATNTVISTVPVGHQPYGVAVGCTHAYITNNGDNTVSVIDTATNVPTAIVPVGSSPYGVAVTPDEKKVYVVNDDSNTTSVIDTCTNTITATIHVGGWPIGVAVSPDGTKAYVTNAASGTVSVIDTATDTVISTVPNVGDWPFGVVVSPDGTKVYVANSAFDTGNNTVAPTGDVSVIDTATNIVTHVNVGAGWPSGIAISPDGTTVYVVDSYYYSVHVIDTATNVFTTTVYPIGTYPFGISVAPDGSEVYVAINGGAYVSVINPATNTAEAAVLVGNTPFSFGQFIQPAGCCLGCPHPKPHKPGQITLITDPATQSVSLLKFPVGDDEMTVPFGNIFGSKH
jgi:YVTN family beta-propeller protein